MWDVPARWDPSRSHDAISRVDIYSRREFVASTDAIADGMVTEKRASGVRATLDLTLDPTPEWLEWLALPNVELAPYAGMSWGTTEHLCPLGVFPVAPPELSVPVKQVSISAQDRWSLIDRDDFTYVQSSYAYVWMPDEEHVATVPISRAVVQMINQTNLGADVDNRATNLANLPDMLLDKSRHQTILDFVESIGAEVFVDRLGQPVIQDRANQAGRDLTDGDNGTIISATAKEDLAGVVNRIGVSTSNRDAVFFPVFVAITDPEHPAHEDRIWKRSLRYSSPLLTSADQALTAGRAMLEEKSTKARSWTVTCVPDPSRMPGDIVTVTCDLGTITGVVNEVRHPLGDGEQTVVVGAL
jgi:hypothetical protein